MKAQSIKLKSITSKITKGTTPTTMGFDFIDYGINFIKAEALNGDSELDAEGFAYINDDAHNKLKRSILQKNDVLVTIAGVNIGKTGIVKQKHLPANTNQAVGIVRIKPDLASSVYIYYWFKNPLTFKHLQNINAQAAQPNINLEMLGDLSLFLPNIQTQQKIASTIFIYDELINNNRRRIQLLEESARLLFREWFVYFRFPRLRQGFGGQAGHEKACPVESINSTGVKIVDGVPEGWEKGPIKKYYDTTSGGTPSREHPEYYQGDINWVKTQELDEKYIFDTEERVTQEAISKSSAKIFPANTLLVSIYGNANIGRTGILAKPAASNQACVAFFPKKPYFHFIYLQQYLQMIRDYLVGMSQGAAQTNISQDTLRKVNILMPDELFMNKFLKIAEPLYEQIKNLQYQNQKLAHARDLLLPRLMSGAIDPVRYDKLSNGVEA